ncbi:MAG: hypothetical protein GY757_13620, partial [bacterium]|nr:hypothetical protein [bacterium]
ELTALEITAAVIIHDGEDAGESQEIILTHETLQTAPSVTIEEPEPWLPRIKGFRPHYFTREHWERKDRQAKNEEAKMEKNELLPYQKAIKKSAKKVSRMAEHYSIKFNLCSLNIFEPPPAGFPEIYIPDIRLLKPITEKLSLNYFSFDREALSLRAYTSGNLHSKEMREKELETYDSFKLPGVDLTGSTLRRKIWDGLINELELLGGRT